MTAGRLTRRIAAAVAASVGAAVLASAAAPAHAATAKVAGLGNNDFVYVNAAQFGTTSLAKASVAQTAAGVGTPFDTTSGLSELLFKGATSGKNAYGHGAGVSLGLGQGANQVPQAQLTVAEASSPKPSDDKTSLIDLSNTPLKPVVSAVVQPDTAAANTTSVNDYCILGAPLSGGSASVANLSVLNAGATSVVKADQVVNTASTQTLVPNASGNFGLQAQSVTEPVGLTVLAGTPNPLTIKILNPVLLTAIAGGHNGEASVTYGADGKGTVPVVSLSSGSNTTTLTMAQLVGSGGLKIHLGIADLDIGVPPTVSTSPDGTKASASADLIKVTVPGTTAPTVSGGGLLGAILTPVLKPVVQGASSVLSAVQSALQAAGLQVADIRIGHQEVSSQVPPGGINCHIPMTKTAFPNPVQVGNTFVYTITAYNTICVSGLMHVRIEDFITADPGVKWTVTGTRPPANTVTDSHVVWNDVGTIPYGKTKSVYITVSVPKGSGAGVFHDDANARGSCGTGSATGKQTTVSLTGKVHVNLPRVVAGPLPKTGSSPWLPIGAGVLLVLATGGALVRRGLNRPGE
jgi:hypothetical protein